MCEVDDGILMGIVEAWGPPSGGGRGGMVVWSRLHVLVWSVILIEVDDVLPSRRRWILKVIVFGDLDWIMACSIGVCAETTYRAMFITLLGINQLRSSIPIQ